MRSETLICAAALALAVAAPVFAQSPAGSAPEQRLVPSTAAAYGQYQGEVSNLMSKPLTTTADVDRALNTFGSPNPDQLSSAWISYAAIVAAQNKDFVNGVRDAEAAYPTSFVTGMRNSVAYARTLKGGEQALQDALTVNAKDSGRISAAGSYMLEQSRSLQKIAWAKARTVSNPGANRDKLKADALLVRPVSDAAKQLFSGPDLNAILASSQSSQGSIWDKVSVFAASAPATALSTLSPVVAAKPSVEVDPKHAGTANRIVTLAALHIINADKTNEDDVKNAMKDKDTSGCIDWAQMQLQACIASAYSRAEISGCLAHHALKLEEEKSPAIGACFTQVAK